MKRLYIVGGYARAGKTTAVDYLQTKGIAKVSTSAALHEVTQKFFKKVLRLNIDTTCKDENMQYDLKTEMSKGSWVVGSRLETQKSINFFKPMRELLITVAEDVLVPVFGRDLFSMYAAKSAEKLFIDNDTVVIETIGGDEYDLLLNYLKCMFLGDTIELMTINIRSSDEDSNADYRQLIPDAIEVWNTKNHEFFNLLDQVLAIRK